LHSNKKHLFTELYDKVISVESGCSGCGACILICPEGRLIFKDHLPEQVSGDKNVCPENENGKCGLCTMVCPRLNQEYTSGNPGGLPIGKYTDILAARTTDQAFKEIAQDGGIVSSILKWGLVSEQWSSVIGYTRDETWHVQPLVVTDGHDVQKACGSKYTFTSIIDGLKRLHESGLSSKPFTVVGLPCHIVALRKLRKLNSKYVKGLELCIGLFCSKAFTYEGLIENKLINEMKIPITSVQKMDIRKGLFTVEMDSGKTYQIPVKELQNYSHSGCSSCYDFSAERADISVGGLGIGDWTIAVIRTAAGEQVLDAVRSSGLIEITSAEKFPKALGLLEKLSLWKHKQAVTIK